MFRVSSILILLLANTPRYVQQDQQQTFWTADTYPNPTSPNEYPQCRMPAISLICDPDGVIANATDRSRLNDDLQQLELRTRPPAGAPILCQQKGITAVVLLARRIDNMTTTIAQMANTIKDKWSLDPNCHRSIVILLSSGDKKFWVARDNRVPIIGTEFTAIFNEQRALLAAGDYVSALHNIIVKTMTIALNKMQQQQRSKQVRNQQQQTNAFKKYPHN
jgi:hypothetical protein